MDYSIILIIGLFIAFFVYQIINKLKSFKVMDEMIIKHYAENDLEVTFMSRLNISEKIKYGVPINPFLSFYRTSLGSFSNADSSLYRKVETIDKGNNEQIRYLQIDLSNSKITVNEFDVYEF